MVPDQRPRSITIKHNIFIFYYYYLCIHAQLKSRRFRNRPGGTKNGTRKNGASGPGMIPEKLQRGRGEKNRRQYAPGKNAGSDPGKNTRAEKTPGEDQRQQERTARKLSTAAAAEKRRREKRRAKCTKTAPAGPSRLKSLIYAKIIDNARYKY